MSGSYVWSDALARALGEIVANQRRSAALELAQTRAELAEARATIAELVTSFRELEARVREECAAAALEVVRAMLADIRPPKDGRDGVTLEELEPLVEAVVRDVVEAQPPAPAGKDGAPGMLPPVEEWTDRVYYAGEVVTDEGAVWQARVDTGRPPAGGDWIRIAAAGRDGKDGRTPSLRGLWTAEEDYRALDIVGLNGSAFAAVSDDPGPCPGDGWRLLCARGKAGKPGEPGRPATASAIALVGAAIDGEGLLTLVNGDGSTVTVDLFPVLDKVRRS